MDQRTAAAPSVEDQPRFELMDEGIKSESVANSPLPSLVDQLPAFKSSSAPLPSTETAEPTESTTTSTSTPMAAATIANKKKGTASTIKKVPKRPKSGGDSRRPRKKAAPGSESATNTTGEDGSEDDESDNGPYCICRGPDDHRWMICCEKCEDWFHGECVHLAKDIGEALIEKFICPNCTSDGVTTIYKKTCALSACRKAARLTQKPSSVFCSNEHAQTWWERMLAKLPKGKTKGALSNGLSQEEFMALLNSNLATIDGDGGWKLKTPFADKFPTQTDGGETDQLAQILTEEEKEYLDNAANARLKLAEETVLCHKMLSLIEMVQERRRSAINAGRFSEDICGYDQRLDTICARDAFASFTKCPEGEAIFQTSKVDDPLGEGDEVRGMCERKRCKVHGGWQKMLVMGIRHQIREMADQGAEVGEEERIIREAAGERWRRRQAEKNWVEVLDG